MSDGHSEWNRNRQFFDDRLEERKKNIQRKLEKICLVIDNETIVALDGVQLMYSEKYEEGLKLASIDMLSENGSRMLNFREVVRNMIVKGLI